MTKKETKISVFSVLNSPFAVSTEDGEKLFKLINKSFKKEERVLLDFSEIYLIVSTFLNASIGQLYGLYESEFLKEHLNIENLSSEDFNILKKVIERAKEYFNDKENLNKFFKKHFPDAE